MLASRIFPVAFALAMSTAAIAQEPAAPAPAPSAAAQSAMPPDCAKAMARHDHGAEKGTPMPMSASMPTKCDMATSASSAKSKAKPGHDHSKFHKLM